VAFVLLISNGDMENTSSEREKNSYKKSLSRMIDIVELDIVKLDIVKSTS